MSNSIDYVAILIQFMVAAGFVVTTMVVTHAVGPKRATKQKLVPFESGIESIGNARIPFSIKYFLTAIPFLCMNRSTTEIKIFFVCAGGIF